MMKPAPYRSPLALLLSAALVSTSVAACKPKRVEEPAAEVKSENEEDANRFAALRVDGTVTYMWQALIVPGVAGPELRNDSNIHQCWYRYDTPPGEAIAERGTENFELLKKYADKAVNVNPMSVTTDVLTATFNELHLSLYAKDENGNAVDNSQGGVQGVLEHIKEKEIDTLFTAIVAAEEAVKEEMLDPDAITSPLLYQTEDGSDHIVVTPQRAYGCPRATEIVRLQSEKISISPQAIATSGGTNLTEEGDQSMYIVGVILKAGVALAKVAPRAIQAAPRLLKIGQPLRSISAGVLKAPQAVGRIAKFGLTKAGSLKALAASKWNTVVTTARTTAQNAAKFRTDLGTKIAQRQSQSLANIARARRNELATGYKSLFGRNASLKQFKEVRELATGAPRSLIQPIYMRLPGGATRKIASTADALNLEKELARLGSQRMQAATVQNLKNQWARQMKRAATNPKVQNVQRRIWNGINFGLTASTGWTAKECWDTRDTWCGFKPKNGTSLNLADSEGEGEGGMDFYVGGYTSTNASRPARIDALIELEKSDITAEEKQPLREELASFYEADCPETASRIRAGQGDRAVIGSKGSATEPAFEGCPL